MRTRRQQPRHEGLRTRISQLRQAAVSFHPVDTLRLEYIYLYKKNNNNSKTQLLRRCLHTLN